jgi:butyrate kinase
MSGRILAINPGSTSTKLALFDDASVVDSIVLQHRAEVLAGFPHVWDQEGLRRTAVEGWMASHPSSLSAVVAMGGLLRPLKGGTYLVNEAMIADARENLQGEHASNLGCVLASDMARAHACRAYVVDPVSVDEFEPLARYSGHPLIGRRALSHALNIHATARRAALELNIPYDQSRFVLAHLGGGISICPLRAGRIIDANDANSDGPFSPERTGGLPLQQFLDLCFSGTYTREELSAMIRGRGGLAAYLGTSIAADVEKDIARGEERAREIYEAMAYQIAKEIGAMATVLNGTIDAVVLTGGLSHSALLTEWIQERVKFLGRILVYPGEDEMRALVEGALRVLRGAESALEY